jgi:inorganic pyrophosphatase
MPASLYDLDPGEHFPKVVRMVVEIPKNSTNKYEYDADLGLFRLDRTLYSPVHYPGDYGFIPGTLSDDGDPLDVIALVEEPSFSGCLIEVRPIGLLKMIDRKKHDEKILAVPDGNPRYDEVRNIDQIFTHIRHEIEHFFTIYKELEGRATATLGWGGLQATRKIVLKSRDNYLKKRSASPSKPKSGQERRQR